MLNTLPLNYRRVASNKPLALAQCNYVPLTELAGYIAEPAQKILAVISFGNKEHDIQSLPCLHIKVAAPQLGGTRLVEVWTSSAPVLRRQQGGIQYAVSEDMIFGSILLPESDEATLDTITCTAYRRIFDLLQTEACPHLIRVWNYVPDINCTANGLERYQRFCLGRHQAFSERNQFFEHDLPAATTIGVLQGDLHIHFLAARHTGRQIENPRQVSAFRYPHRYGPRSPSFSRAILKKWNDGHHIYISGTASIVGHESRHEGDLDRQLQETVRNIESLLGHAGETSETRVDCLNTLSSVKIYIRHPRHLSLVKDSLERYFHREIPAMYLQGDICRSDLLLEIEAICHVQDH